MGPLHSEAVATWLAQHGQFQDRPSYMYPDRDYHSYAFSVRHTNRALLRAAVRLIGCGKIKAYPCLQKRDGTQDYAMTVTGRTHLIEKLVPLMDRHTHLMLPDRRTAYEAWRDSLLAHRSPSAKQNDAREHNAEINRRYRQSPRGQANTRQYTRRYYQSEAGRATKERMKARKRVRRLEQRYSATSLSHLAKILESMLVVLGPCPERRRIEAYLADCRAVADLDQYDSEASSDR